jgi:hypothetical protein
VGETQSIGSLIYKNLKLKERRRELLEELPLYTLTVAGFRDPLQNYMTRAIVLPHREQLVLQAPFGVVYHYHP